MLPVLNCLRRMTGCPRPGRGDGRKTNVRVTLRRSTLLLLRLAFDTNPRPGNGLKTCGCNFVLTIHADAVGAVIDPVNCLFYGSKKFGVGLFKSQANVNFTLLAGLVDPVSAFRTRFGRRGPCRGRSQ